MLADEVAEEGMAAWPALVAATAHAFEAFVGAKDFPCLGAKASLAKRKLHSVCAHDIASACDDESIAASLQAFATRHDEHSLFVSVVVLFPCSARLSERDFETALWQRLRAIHAIDRRSYRWDASVSNDPGSAGFSMSIGGRAFYVVGLHPAASRRARRFRCPALVFNLHSQFERLRADGRYDKLRRAIIRRDVAYDGTANPMLAVHGESPEARQYSGRRVDADWVCPFRATDGSEHR